MKSLAVFIEKCINLQLESDNSFFHCCLLSEFWRILNIQQLFLLIQCLFIFLKQNRMRNHVIHQHAYLIQRLHVLAWLELTNTKHIKKIHFSVFYQCWIFGRISARIPLNAPVFLLSNCKNGCSSRGEESLAFVEEIKCNLQRKILLLCLIFFVFLEWSVNCYLMVFHACRIQFIEKQASLSAQEFGNVSYTETVTVLPGITKPRKNLCSESTIKFA